MAQVAKKGSQAAPVMRRVSPIKPGLRGARNWATAQVRAASYTKRGFWRLALTIISMIVFVVLMSLWLGGFLPDARKVTQQATQNTLTSLGFVVDRIDVVGEGRIREQDVRVALGVDEGDYLFGIDIQDAQKRVQSLSWVEMAVVRRLWPDRVVVQIIERQPYALWQKSGKVQLVDISGAVISDAEPAAFAHLPLVIGEGAETQVTAIQGILAPYPAVAKRVDAMSLLPSNRWDIRLDGGAMWIKLPKTNPGAALTELTKMNAASQILDRDLAVIDLRLPDRLTVLPRQSKPA